MVASALDACRNPLFFQSSDAGSNVVIDVFVISFGSEEEPGEKRSTESYPQGTVCVVFVFVVVVARGGGGGGGGGGGAFSCCPVRRRRTRASVSNCDGP